MAGDNKLLGQFSLVIIRFQVVHNTNIKYESLKNMKFWKSWQITTFPDRHSTGTARCTTN